MTKKIIIILCIIRDFARHGDNRMKKFNIDKYVMGKIASLKETDRSFSSIYNLMFRERDMIMFEWTDGSRIKSMTYGECHDEIEGISRALKKHLQDIKIGTKIGLYAQNSIKWVQIFWAILKCGYVPLLLNTKVDKKQLELAV